MNETARQKEGLNPCEPEHSGGIWSTVVRRRGAPLSMPCQGMCNARRTCWVSVPVTRIE